jgi:maltose O-acetyltransferase
MKNIIKKIIKFIFKKINSTIGLLGYLKARSMIKKVGKGTGIGLLVEIKYGENIQIGCNTTIGHYVTLGAKSSIIIGNDCRISKGVQIETAGLDLSKPPPYIHNSKPIFIENGVWIATNAIILGGVTIGTNSIIGAGAVVTKNVEPNSIVVGYSAKPLEKKIIQS